MKILAIVGSLRADSFNKQLAEFVENQCKGQNVDFEILDYTEVPFFSEDLEEPELPEVAEVRKKVREADGLWIFTPEYNHYFSGVLKNLLDWLSRPVDGVENPILSGKPVAISGAGLGMAGTSHAQDHLITLLNILNMKIMNYPRLTMPVLDDEVDGNGRLGLEDNDRLKKQLDKFVKFVEENK